MAVVPSELIGDAYTSDYAWSVLESLTAIGNRMAGQEGEREGAEYIRDSFTELGFREVAISEFDVPGWWRGSSTLSVRLGHDQEFTGSHELIALAGSPAAVTSGDLVDVGCGLPEDFEAADVRDKLVLASSRTPDSYGRWVHRTEKYGLAVENGAAGFLFYNEIPGYLPLTGNIGGDGPGDIPAVGLSHEVGNRLVKACRDGSPSATLEVNANSHPSTSRNVEAVIGPETDEEILLTAHVDAHDIAEGATDNGVGCALVAEVSRLLDRYIDDLGTAVRVVIFGSEEIGLRGAHHWIETHERANVKSIVNIDGNGTWEDVTMYTHGFAEIADAFESTADSLRAAMTVDEGYLPHSDHWPFVQRGVPGAMIRSESNTGRGWGHTHGDTLDKLDPKPLRDLAIAITAGIVQLADPALSIDHRDIEQVRNDLIEEGHAAGLRAAGDWPFDE